MPAMVQGDKERWTLLPNSGRVTVVTKVVSPSSPRTPVDWNALTPQWQLLACHEGETGMGWYVRSRWRYRRAGGQRERPVDLAGRKLAVLGVMVDPMSCSQSQHVSHRLRF